MNTYWNDGTELRHYGILGQKWGVRRYQNPDGTWTEEGKRRYGSNIQKMEKSAIDRRYKEKRKNGGGFVFKSYRYSTGKNFEDAEAKFESMVLNSKEYDDLSRKAFDAEKKRLMYEKKVYR